MRTRTYYRLALSALCALAAWAGPIWFLADRPKLGYLVGGFVAALLTWAFLEGIVRAEPKLEPWLQGVLGAGAGLLSWATISLVAVFDIIPKVAERGLERFDPVWIMGGLSPLVVVAVALWRAARDDAPVLNGLFSALLRFSVPLFGLEVVTQSSGLPKQYRWLFLFTGVMFLVLDGLGTGDDLPLVMGPASGADGRRQHQ